MAKIEDVTIKIISKNGFLLATIPNGDIIPCQVDAIITQGMTRGIASVQVNLKTVIRLDEFEILKQNNERKFIDNINN